MMDEAAETRDALEQVAESYLERYRRGERPTVTEYVARYPDLEDGIRSLFPTLLLMERLGPEGSTPSPSAAITAVEEIRQLGEYRIVREIGRGGMGVVYEAEQESLGRHVALKVLPGSGLSDDVQVERFRQEARAAARLHHTNIVPVFGVGEDQGVCYYAMQFIRGQSLADVLTEIRRLRFGGAESGVSNAARSVAREIVAGHYALQTTATVSVPDPSSESHPSSGRLGPSPPAGPSQAGAVVAGTHSLLTGDADSSEDGSTGGYFRSVARVGLQVAEALAYAHGEGILHRDIKPSNLLLDARGTVWVTDFGLAKVDDSVNLTQDGNIIGTLRYMAPERLEGHSDSRSDVYGIGITLYELLTLHPAFNEEDRVKLIRDVTTSEPVAPRRIDRSIPRDLETIVLRSISKEPSGRYASAQTLADDLRRFLEYEPIAARRSSLPERFLRWRRRNPAVAALSLTTVGLLVVLAVGALLFAAKLAVERNTAVTNLDRALDAEEEVRERLATARWEEGRAWRNSDRAGRRARGLAALRSAALLGAGEDIRSDLIGILAQTDLEAEVVLDRDPSCEGVVFGPFHELAAVTMRDQSVSVCHADNLRDPIVTIPSCGAPVAEATISPDGHYLALRYHRAQDPVEVWDLEEEVVVFKPDEPQRALTVAFHPDGHRIAVPGKEGAVVEVDLATGEEVDRHGVGPEVFRLAYSPTGRWLSVVGRKEDTRAVWVLDLERQTVSTRLLHPEAVAYSAWHPREPILATACFDYKVHLWNVETSTHLRELEGHTAQVVRVAFCPTGRYLASASWDGRTILWNPESGHAIAKANGSFTDFRRRDPALGFRVGDYRFGVWKIRGGDAYRLLSAPVGLDKGPLQIATSPDGRWLAAACETEGARVWSLDDPQESRTLEAGVVHDVGFLPDGSALLTLGHAGLLSWPIRTREWSDGVKLGPPEPLGIRGGRFSIDGSGRLVAVVQTHNVVVYRLDGPREEVSRCRHVNINGAQLSASGRLLVSWTWQGRDVLVWDVETGDLVQRFETDTARARFSPDERWLVVGTGPRYEIYDTRSWTLTHEVPREGAGNVPGPLAFTGDSKLVFLAHSRTHLDLYALEEWREIGRFEPPLLADNLTAVDVDPQGEFLAASVTSEAVHLWHLDEIQRELADLELEWTPGFPSSDDATHHARELLVDYGPEDRWRRKSPHARPARDQELLRGYTTLIEAEPTADRLLERAAVLERLGSYQDALADLDAALDSAPGEPKIRLARSRILSQLRRDDAALTELDEAIRLGQGVPEPSDSPGGEAEFRLVDALRERATLHLREGRFREARADFEQVLARVPDDGEAATRLAWIWVLEADPQWPLEDVLPRVERVCADRLDDYACVRTTGALLYHAGRLEEAEARLERAIELNGGQSTPSVSLYLAMVRHSEGRPAEAAEHYQWVEEWYRDARDLPTYLVREMDVLQERASRTLGIVRH